MISSAPPAIDLVVITRDASPLQAEVKSAIDRQRGVQLNVHRVIGEKKTSDLNRWETIARARNAGVVRGDSPWLMYLDDDVILGEDCVHRLYHALSARENYAALAADYLGEASPHKRARHVAMGATLFRRSVLRRQPFRSEVQKCECMCCCEDLRRTGMRIDYLGLAKAWHLPADKKPEHGTTRPDASTSCSSKSAEKAIDPQVVDDAKIFVAFNRRDLTRFRDLFLRTLRGSGNLQDVIAVAYGLYPSELRNLSRLPGVHVVRRVVNGQMPPVRRLDDFAELASALPSRTPVAYWDAGDTVVQDRLDQLWMLTQRHPEKLLAAREPVGYPYNAAIRGWTHSIRHPEKRRRAFELFATHPFLNSGFAAGTASVMHQYFSEASRLRRSSDLLGTTDWGDQTALNLYCHSDRSRWQEIADGWNFCLHDRRRGEVHLTPHGKFTNVHGSPIHVVHGNARSLAKLAIVR